MRALLCILLSECHVQVADVSVLGITESFRVKQQVLVSAHEAAEMILRVDNILKAAPRYFLCFVHGTH